jgi:hypothetical protein
VCECDGVGCDVECMSVVWCGLGLVPECESTLKSWYLLTRRESHVVGVEIVRLGIGGISKEMELHRGTACCPERDGRTQPFAVSIELLALLGLLALVRLYELVHDGDARLGDG